MGVGGCRGRQTSINTKRSFDAFISSLWYETTFFPGNKEVKRTNCFTVKFTVRNALLKCLYRLVKLDLLLQVQLHDPVVVIDTVAMEMVHFSCSTRQEKPQ